MRQASIAAAAAAALLTTIVPAAGAERSCAAEVGARQAAADVEHCVQVSPATRPPCNAANPCGLITDEIRRGCELIASAGPPGSPGFCDGYVGTKAGRR